MKKRIAVLGSAFNPPSLGHKDVIDQIKGQYDEVWLVPSFKHAFGKRMIPYELRLQLVESFVYDLGYGNVHLKAVEHLIKTEKGAVFTWDLMNHLQKGTEDELAVVIGPDNEKNWSAFYMSDEIASNWHLEVVKERVDIRSTYIRNNMNEGLSIAHLVTPGVDCFLNKMHDQCLI
ncbi:nicotinate-nicotinamide nucleotide adenylyltransferase [Vibrio owensii]|uniref:nicotinate-nicotinamide nucleotide adenylyltransferase n=1 Tax=Vibrio owensii TaxID=696485 RepID=UPI003CC58DC6